MEAHQSPRHSCVTLWVKIETAETETGFWKETLKRQRRVAKVDPPSCNPEKERERGENFYPARSARLNQPKL